MYFSTEAREEPLEFHDQRQKQRLLGNLVQSDTSRFASFATFCEKCLGNPSY